MDSIFDLISVILKIGLAGGFVLALTKLLKFKKNNGVKTEILNLQARISQLRLALRGKIKKKSNVFRASFKGQLTEGDLVDNMIKELTENNFETGDHFQQYFDTSRKIVSYIHMQSDQADGAPKSERNIENNFMCSDFKTEMDIVRIIKVMSSLSAKINTRIDENNRINPSQSIEKVSPLVFPALGEISRIFNDTEDSEKSESSATEKAS